MRELTIEQYLIAQTEARGGLCIKHGNAGWPDRIVLLPRGRHGWAELKRPGGRERVLQLVRHKQLREAGALVATIDSLAAVNRFLDQVELHRP